MSLVEEKPGRSGGRAARRATRAAPLAEDIRPVRAGLEGGTYKPFSDGDVEKVHEAVLEVLETIGLSQGTPTLIDACDTGGSGHGR